MCKMQAFSAWLYGSIACMVMACFLLIRYTIRTVSDREGFSGFDLVSANCWVLTISADYDMLL